MSLRTQLLTVLLALGVTMPALAGQEGHGGDPLAGEFVARARKVLSQLDSFNSLAPDITAADLAHLHIAVEQTRVDVVDFELYDHRGDLVDARVIKDPLRDPGYGKRRFNMIQLNRPALYRWLREGASIDRLVLHEYLWVIGKNDENYRISSQFYPEDIEYGFSRVLKGDICKDYTP